MVDFVSLLFFKFFLCYFFLFWNKVKKCRRQLHVGAGSENLCFESKSKVCVTYLVLWNIPKFGIIHLFLSQFIIGNSCKNLRVLYLYWTWVYIVQLFRFKQGTPPQGIVWLSGRLRARTVALSPLWHFTSGLLFVVNKSHCTLNSFASLVLAWVQSIFTCPYFRKQYNIKPYPYSI